MKSINIVGCMQTRASSQFLSFSHLKDQSSIKSCMLHIHMHGRAIRGSSLFSSEGRLFNACHALQDIVPWMVEDAGLRILLE